MVTFAFLAVLVDWLVLWPVLVILALCGLDVDYDAFSFVSGETW